MKSQLEILTYWKKEAIFSKPFCQKNLFFKKLNPRMESDKLSTRLK